MVEGWGRWAVPGVEKRSSDLLHLSEDAVLTRGLGRSYGDASLPPPGCEVVAASPKADRILEWDPETGALRAEAGLSLREINRIFQPRLWCSPTLPGTQLITLGGMVAADVHDKSHHRLGSFGEHVTSLKMRVADGRVVRCSREENSDLFRATIGGMGLTGHILEVAFTLHRMPSRWVYWETKRVANIDEYVDSLKDAAANWPYTMGWIDCLSQGEKMGRGIQMAGRWAEADEAPARPPRPKFDLMIPFEFPARALNRFSVAAFNTAYYWKHLQRKRAGIVHPEDFFHPLDAIAEWNRMYGRRGFTQYQCVLPEAAGRGAARRFLELLTSKGGASFLCVIKDCGPEGLGLISFPKKGISIALDIAIRDETQALVDTLNEHVIGEGGRIYLAKDTFTRPEHFRQMEPRLDEWLEIRRRWDPKGRFRSALSVRLFGDR